MASILVKTRDYSPMVFGQKLKLLTSAKRIPCKSISQGVWNSVNFSLIAPSTASSKE